MKRILTIQDISCFGKCSITIALPVISAMGVEGVILPTALFSTHTLFPDYRKISLSEQMMAFAEQWKNNGIKFDAIYTGYLGSIEEIDTVLSLVDMFRDENTLVFVDPVMGDNGKLYRGFDEEYVIRNRKLCECSDIIVPNLTEACMLTGTKYREDRDESYYAALCGKLCDMGAKTAVLTGASLSEGKTGVYGMRASDRAAFNRTGLRATRRTASDSARRPHQRRRFQANPRRESCAFVARHYAPHRALRRRPVPDFRRA